MLEREEVEMMLFSNLDSTEAESIVRLKLKPHAS